MRTAEQVTFGGDGLDRAAKHREDPSELAKLAAQSDALWVVLWRGKPLSFTEPARLTLVPGDHPVLGECGVPVFLGLSEGAPRFACDLSAWEPEDPSMAEAAGFLDQSEQVHPDAPDGAAFVELRRTMALFSARDAELAATARAILSWHETHSFCARCGGKSEVSQGGWRRSCPDCGAHHFPRTDPVVIMLVTHGNSVLVGRSPGWPEGMYSLLAGFVEPGETIEAAVRRETLEEAGVEVGQVDYLSSQPWPFPSSLMFGCRGRAKTTAIKIDPDEIEDARWLAREEVMDIFAGNRSDILPARKGAIAHFILENWLADQLD